MKNVKLDIKHNSEQKVEDNNVNPIFCQAPCYVQPFWKHSDIEIYNESNLDTMGRMPDNCIDLTVTSPPYDNLRYYNGYSFEFEDVAKELFRVTKPGGVVVWVVGDATIDGCETLTSFMQALYFKKIGFKVETMIYKKKNPIPQTNTKRYSQSFEYMFILSRGTPKTFNANEKMNLDYYKNWINKGKSNRGKDGINKQKKNEWNDKSKISNVWEYSLSRWSNEAQSEHPATFPEQLAADHIETWSNEGDLVYDCFGGSGTTCKMAYLKNRKTIMSEISSEYCELSKQRLSNHLPRGLFE